MLEPFLRKHQWLAIKIVDNETLFQIAERYDRLHILKDAKPALSTVIDQEFPENTRADIDPPSDNVNTNSDTKQNDILLKFYRRCQHHDPHEWLEKIGVHRILMDRKKEPNCYEDDGFTPLMVAVKYGRLECVKLLLREAEKHIARNTFEKRSFYFRQTVLHICANIRGNDVADYSSADSIYDSSDDSGDDNSDDRSDDSSDDSSDGSSDDSGDDNSDDSMYESTNDKRNQNITNLLLKRAEELNVNVTPS